MGIFLFGRQNRALAEKRALTKVLNENYDFYGAPERVHCLNGKRFFVVHFRRMFPSTVESPVGMMFMSFVKASSVNFVNFIKVIKTYKTMH